MVKKTAHLTVLFFIALSLTATPATAAQELHPFRIKNQNPFLQIYGLPATEPAKLTPAQKINSYLFLDIANSSAIESRGNESIRLDGETYRLALELRYGLNQKTEMGIELPFISHSRGFMDNFIEGWHDTFGLTNSERNKTTSNTLSYQYIQNNETIVDMSEPTEGIGDVRLFAARQLFQDNSSALSIHTGLKLPTGSAQRLMGSGSTDLSVSLAYIQQRSFTRWQMTSFANAGLLFLGDSDILSRKQNSTAGFGSTGVIWDSGYSLDLKAQLDFHTKIYDSPLDQLGKNTIQLTVGGSLHLSPTTYLDIGVGENIFTDNF
jgi:hypothetical protein